jgi:hypothetical protein
MNRRLLIIPTALLIATSILAGNAPRAEAIATAAQGNTMSPKGGTPGAPMTPVGTGFPYEGILLVGGTPANGPYDFTFTLYDSLSGGAQVGSTVTVLNQTVTDGHFQALLDFGNMAFWGQARWIEIAWRPAGGGSYTTLTPRRPAPVVPYALTLSPGAIITATTPSNPAFSLYNTGIGLSVTSDVKGVSANSSAGSAVFGQSTTGNGIYGTSTSGSGVRGTAFSNSGTAVFGDGNSGTGVRGTSTSKDGVVGTTDSATTGHTSYAGVLGQSTGSNGIGVKGIASTGPTAKGVYGSSTEGDGVYGYSYSGDGVYGRSVNGGTGVRGDGGPSAIGVVGEGSFGVFGSSDTANGAGVYGLSSDYKAVVGDTYSGYGVFGHTSVGYAIYGDVTTYGYGYAGYFQGKVHVNGTLSKSAGSFKIDHPMDPENKYLSHSFVESPDMMNVYNGNITTDVKGEAVVQLPDYFESLNKDYRYQLTVMGQFAQAIVSEKVKDNRFTIKTDKSNVEVSWQVTGIRKDPYAEQHRIPVVEDKPKDEQGTYLNPTEWGQPESKGLNYQEPQQRPEVSTKP